MTDSINKMVMMQSMTGLTQQGLSDFFEICGFKMCRSSVSSRARSTLKDAFLDIDQYDNLIETLKDSDIAEVVQVRDNIIRFYEFSSKLVADITGADTTLSGLSDKYMNAQEVLDDDDEGDLFDGDDDDELSDEDFDDGDLNDESLNDDELVDGFESVSDDLDDDELDDDLDDDELDDDLDDDELDDDELDDDELDDDLDDDELDNDLDDDLGDDDLEYELEDDDLDDDLNDDLGLDDLEDDDLDDFINGQRGPHKVEDDLDLDEVDCDALNHLIDGEPDDSVDVIDTGDEFDDGAHDVDEFDIDNIEI